MRIVMVSVLMLGALSVRADEARDKRAASQPGAVQILPADRGLSTGLTVPRARVPAEWLKRLKTVRGAEGRVLVPAAVPVQAQLVVGPTWYSLSWREGPRHVALLVRYAGHTIPGFDEPELDPEQMVVSRTHGVAGIAATFEGAGVNFDVECAEPAKDPACSSDSNLRERVMNLAVVP